MNTQTPTRPPSLPRPSAQQLGHAAALDSLQRRAPRTQLWDRVAMRVGLALLIWGTRPERSVAPPVDGFRADPRATARERHAVDESLARHALLHGAPPHQFLR